MENENLKNDPTQATVEPAVYQPLSSGAPAAEPADPDDPNETFLANAPNYFNLFD